MSTAYRSTRIAQEHHCAGKGNTKDAHNTDDRYERAVLATDNVDTAIKVPLNKDAQARILANIEAAKRRMAQQDEY